MTNEDYLRQQRILKLLNEEVKEFPSFFNDVISTGILSMQNKIQDLTNQAVDMEAIAVAFSTTMDGKYKEKNQQWIEDLLISKLEKHQGKTAFMNWSKTLERLRS